MIEATANWTTGLAASKGSVREMKLSKMKAFEHEMSLNLVACIQTSKASVLSDSHSLAFR